MVVEPHLCKSEGVQPISRAGSEGVCVVVKLVGDLNSDCRIHIHGVVVAGRQFVAPVRAAESTRDISSHSESSVGQTSYNDVVYLVNNVAPLRDNNFNDEGLTNAAEHLQWLVLANWLPVPT